MTRTNHGSPIPDPAPARDAVEAAQAVAAPQEIIFEGCRVYAIAPEDYDAMVRDLATMEQNVRAARADERAKVEAELIAEIEAKPSGAVAALLRVERARLAALVEGDPEGLVAQLIVAIGSESREHFVAARTTLLAALTAAAGRKVEGT